MTDDDRIGVLFAAQRRAAHARRQSGGLRERRGRLKDLLKAIDRHEASLLAAMHADYAKPAAEARLWEILPVRLEIAHARAHLRRWMRSRRAWPSLATIGTQARVIPEPKGVALILAPWNFPVLLALGPLVSALAAGNSVILKPSELTPATSAALAAMLAEAFAPDLVAVVEGGPEVAERLLDLGFDHVFFTGSTAVGRKVMEQAARHPSPVTLELGGRSPAIVGPDADLARAARWIAWGRFASTGQTCVAPDHVFVHASVEAALTQALEGEIARAYGATPQARAASPDYGRIVNVRHFARIVGLLDEALAAGARLVTGGERDEASRYIAPTLIAGTAPAMRIRQEEIFGPVLPVIAYADLADPIAEINAGGRPLALYVFARDRSFIERVRRETSSGGFGINLSVVQFVHPNLPFGGIGASGLGAGHGRAGFETFSHLRPVLRNRASLLPLVFPPYGRMAGLVSRVLGWLTR